jgi:hypothetical protein
MFVLCVWFDFYSTTHLLRMLIYWSVASEQSNLPKKQSRLLVGLHQKCSLE